ncbi:heme peroxidase [Xylariales sp. PMI_506]|nr:heme peroxidase [Xylariales sp. PMI_506]
MEHLLVDNSGTNADGFFAAITPCSTYLGFASNAANRGEQSAAQWVRVAFHDFTTADVVAGTGGLDGSVGYEADRAENPGLFINDTLQFVCTITAYLGMADNIALGVVAGVTSCQSYESYTPGISLRAGRVDAAEAGPSGVPDPTTDIETTLAQFAAAGFSQSDAIALTACGHSLGRIHYSNFPDIVNEDTVTSTNLDGGVPFDSTPAVFDANVVNEYLENNGSLGGPLVTATNISDRSDLRLYSSDSNVTMQSISEDSTFRATCYSLFERMIDTVPSGVTLTEPITPMTWKAVNVALDINNAGIVSVSGLIRNLYATSPPATVDYTTTSSVGNSSIQTSSPSSGKGKSFLYGNTVYYPFNTTIDSPGTTSVNIQDLEYPINDNIFILPEQSSASGTKLSIKAAVLTSLASGGDMTAVFYVPTPVTGTHAKQIQNVTLEMTESQIAGNYTIYQGSATLSTLTGVVAKVVLGNIASQTVKTSLF